MSFDEKRTWVYVVVTPIIYLIYTALLFVRAGGGPVAEVSYGGLLFGAIGAVIIATILGTIASVIAARGEVDENDERDAAINRHGELRGYTTFSLGILGVLALTVAEVDHFWIGNAIFLDYVVASQVSSVVKLTAYRSGLPAW